MTIEMADRLIALRRAHGLSQEDVANRLGVSRQAVSKWERVEASPDADNLIALLQLYNITLEDLLPSEKKPQPTVSRPTRLQKARGQKLRELREARGMTVEGLSAALGVPEATFAAWESGEATPSPEEQAAVAEALGVAESELTRVSDLSSLNFSPVDEVPAEEKARLIAAHEEESRRRYRRGRAILWTVVGIESVLLLVHVLSSLNPFSVVLDVLLIVFLCLGKPWARNVFAVLNFLNIIPLIAILAGVNNLLSYDTTLWPLLVWAGVMLVYRVSVGLLFYINRSVAEYLYSRYAG